MAGCTHYIGRNLSREASEVQACNILFDCALRPAHNRFRPCARVVRDRGYGCMSDKPDMDDISGEAFPQSKHRVLRKLCQTNQVLLLPG